MDIANKISVDFTVLKEPRGFIRVLQFVLSIFTFATVSTRSKSGLNVTCGTGTNATTPVVLDYSYPFRLSDHPLNVPICSAAGTKPVTVMGDMAAASQFFCFIGVMTFLLCIFLIVGYVVFSSVFINDSRAATIDFIFSCVWAAMWFIASCAWADGVGQLSHYTNPRVIISDSLLDYCTAKITCTWAYNGDQSTVIVSVLFGFLNFALWMASLWFLYKETKWHKERMESTTENFDQPQAEAQTSGDSSYQAPTY